MTGSKSIIVKDHIRVSLMKHRSDSIFSVTDSQVMIRCESSLLRHSLCNTFSLYLSHFWGHIKSSERLLKKKGPSLRSFSSAKREIVSIVLAILVAFALCMVFPAIDIKTISAAITAGNTKSSTSEKPFFFNSTS